MHANELSNNTTKIIDRLIEYGEITGPFVGESGSKPEQWDNFIEFKKNATEQELVLLIQHPHPVIKCYSFDLLVRKQNKNTFEILKSSLTDSSAVYTQYGCIGDKTQVNDYFIRSVLGFGPKNEYITDKQNKILDSLILFQPNIISEYKNSLLETIEPKKENYNRIRNIALNGNKFAVIGLAKYQKIDDFKLIDTLLHHEYYSIQEFGLRAVKNYPDKVFWNSIKNIHLKQIKKSGSFNYRLIKELYQALVQYKNPESRELLDLTLNQATKSAMKYHKEYIWVALKKYPDKIYDGIIEKMNYSEYELNNLEYEWDL
ncbi:hypothetical protein JBL43_19875 [Aureibaculum sp. A20]|uniref:HEAT repeat domain-containing protein n=1 Tax=Aureibaculum flavum TaxID=2795986 RepID=A0ABS0WX05_9FLAO|nr:hypothetical protein [Aureibaculum flavum]MBJ2176517.1 hypothetical protein [Aureibaculum flavum]